jgi:hypothetical protein
MRYEPLPSDNRSLQWLRRFDPRSIDPCMACDPAAKLSAICGKVPYNGRSTGGTGAAGEPRLLIIYHAMMPDEMFADMSSRYAGQFVVARDLEVY